MTPTRIHGINTILLLSGLLLSFIAGAQQPDTARITQQQINLGASPFLSNGAYSYLKPIRFYDTLKRKKTDSAGLYALYSSIGQAFSFIGNYTTAVNVYDSSLRIRQALQLNMKGNPWDIENKTASRQFITSVQLKEALPAIINAAAQTRIVLVNEAHHLPAHRLTTYALLASLRKIGYTHLALETLAAEYQANTSNTLQFHHGYYLADPLFANLVRYAESLGFVIIPYDCNQADCLSSSDAREAYAAANLQKILLNNPIAKILVHCGLRHAAEDTINGFAPLGKRLKELTGINPLTISQTAISESINAIPNKKTYDAIVTKYNIKQPMIITPGKAFRERFPASQYDCYLVTPPLAQLINPSFLRHTNLVAKQTRLPGINNPAGHLLQLYRIRDVQSGTPLNTIIPAHQQIINTKNKSLVIVAPGGAYLLVIRNNNYDIVTQTELSL